MVAWSDRQTWRAKADAERTLDERGLCPHGVSFAPGPAVDGKSTWCGECFPADEDEGAA